MGKARKKISSGSASRASRKRAPRAAVKVAALIEVVAHSSEEEAAALAGIPLGVLTQLRATYGRPGVDFMEEPNGEVLYTEEGLELVSDWVARGMGPADDLPAARQALVRVLNARPVVVEHSVGGAVVIRVKHKRVAARLPDERVVAVQVKRSDNFMPGMVLREIRQGSAGSWFLVGPLPRKRGRW